MQQELINFYQFLYQVTPRDLIQLSAVLYIGI